MSGGLVRSIMNEIRAAEQYLVSPTNRDPGRIPCQRGLRLRVPVAIQPGLEGLTTGGRISINRLAAGQAQIEVAYSLAHALADIGRPGEALAMAASARVPTDTLLARSCRRCSNARSLEASSRSAALRADTQIKQRYMIAGFLLVAAVGIILTIMTVRSVLRDLGRLSAAAERFGAGDLRPVQMGSHADGGRTAGRIHERP